MAWAADAIARQALVGEAGPGRLPMARALLRLAEALVPGAQDRVLLSLLSVLPEVPASAALPASVTAAGLGAWRDSHLLGLAILAGPRPTQAEVPGWRDAVARSLRAVWDIQDALWRRHGMTPPPPPADRELMVGVLGAFRQAGWPLAALLQVDALACWLPIEGEGDATKATALPGPSGEGTQALSSALTVLEKLPAATPSRLFYVQHAAAVRARLAAGQSPCLFTVSPPKV